MKVVFRADASTQMGTGHVMRCLALADELLRKGHECRFICRDHPGNMGTFIVDKGFVLDLLQAEEELESNSFESDATHHADWLGVSWQLDAKQTKTVLDQSHPDWLIVDHYALDFRWEKQVGTAVGSVMAIDDLADRNHHVDLLLDQNLGRSANDYTSLVPDHCIRLIGPRYALLRPEFYDFRARSIRRRGSAGLKRILISMGGMDIPNTTSPVLEALESSDLPSVTKLDVVMGANAPKLEQIRCLSARSRFDISVSTDVRNMAERMCLADLSIGAAGSTSWERCVLGLPSIAVSQALNQSAILEALYAAGAAEKLDYPLSDIELINIVNGFLHHPEKLATMGANASVVCDGQGVGRVLECLNV